MAMVCCLACRSQPTIFISASFVPSLFGWIPQSLLGPLWGRRRYDISYPARRIIPRSRWDPWEVTWNRLPSNHPVRATLPKYSRVSLVRFHSAGASQDRNRPIDHLGQSTFICQNDMNLDCQPNPQRHAGRYPCSMKIYNNGLAFTGQRFSNALGLNPNLQRNPCASSRLTITVLEGHLYYPVYY